MHVSKIKKRKLVHNGTYAIQGHEQVKRTSVTQGVPCSVKIPTAELKGLEPSKCYTHSLSVWIEYIMFEHRIDGTSVYCILDLFRRFEYYYIAMHVSYAYDPCQFWLGLSPTSNVLAHNC